jgi:peptidoglycan/LPS O-acetylase OafA/YrhL
VGLGSSIHIAEVENSLKFEEDWMTASTRARAGNGADRIHAFDGLRGVAAFIVVVFHYILLLYPHLSPSTSATPVALADTPLHILWNGPFAVAIFFVLSGFVMAAAAERRRASLLSNSVARYFRLAIPATASCILAWIWLTIWPDSAQTLAASVENPSRWLAITYQGEIMPLGVAVADGMVGNFVRGFSQFNNVLWTMQYELVGSIALFVGYWLWGGRVRLLLLALFSLAIIVFIPGPYLAFPLGAALYEARIRGRLNSAPAVVGWAAFITGILLGYHGAGSHERWGLPVVPGVWELGTSGGMISVVAAGFLIYGTLMLHSVGRFFSHPIAVWLGQISFSLYLVHVPPLYTIVAWSYVQHDIHPTLLAIAYFAGVLLLAQVFTWLVDDPMMRKLPKLRAWIDNTLAARGRQKAATETAGSDRDTRRRRTAQRGFPGPLTKNTSSAKVKSKHAP